MLFRSNDTATPRSTPDSLKSRGALGPKGSGAFTLERTEGALTDSTLPTGQSVTFYLRIENSVYFDINGIMNGFRVYSPDGATWGSTVGDTLGTLNWKERFDLTFNIMPFSVTGSGADTIGSVGRTYSTPDCRGGLTTPLIL